MRIDDFFSASDFHKKSELDKAKLLLFYELKINKKKQFVISEYTNLITSLGYSRPNISRLRTKVRNSREFVKGDIDHSFKLHPSIITLLEVEYPMISEETEDIISSDTILPSSLFGGTRGFIEQISKQINATYQQKLFDSCAVMMRRLLEVLLILVYRHHSREDEIKEDNHEYKSLVHIVNYTISNRVISLNKDTVAVLDSFRVLGNLSAHRIEYNCRKNDIDKLKMDFRAAIEELIYGAGLKK